MKFWQQPSKHGKEVRKPIAIMDDPKLKQLQWAHKLVKDSNKMKNKLKSAETAA